MTIIIIIIVIIINIIIIIIIIITIMTITAITTITTITNYCYYFKPLHQLPIFSVTGGQQRAGRAPSVSRAQRTRRAHARVCATSAAL